MSTVSKKTIVSVHQKKNPGRITGRPVQEDVVYWKQGVGCLVDFSLLTHGGIVWGEEEGGTERVELRIDLVGKRFLRPEDFVGIKAPRSETQSPPVRPRRGPLHVSVCSTDERHGPRPCRSLWMPS